MLNNILLKIKNKLIELLASLIFIILLLTIRAYINETKLKEDIIIAYENSINNIINIKNKNIDKEICNKERLKLIKNLNIILNNKKDKK